MLQEGDVWPNAQAEIVVTFQPDQATEYVRYYNLALGWTKAVHGTSPVVLLDYSYSSVSYCDVTGRQTRLPLKMKGGGLGPRLRLSFDELDIQNVFVNSAHSYEVG